MLFFFFVYFFFGKFFIFDIDVLNLVIGVVLLQEKNGQEYVIVYMSKSLNKYEQLYCVIRKEFLVVVNVFKYFYLYLYG